MPDGSCQENPESLMTFFKGEKSRSALTTRSLNLTVLRRNYVLANFSLQPGAEVVTRSLNTEMKLDITNLIGLSVYPMPKLSKMR